MEAFGNASTLRNPDSSRFGKLFKCLFDANNETVVSAQIQPFLLEKSRIVSPPMGERNYHIFNHLIAVAAALTDGTDVQTALQAKDTKALNPYSKPL